MQESIMNEMVAWYHENNHILSIPELAALMHYKLVNIHPFMDGNGRAAKYCEYSQEYLSFLARTGRLSAVKFNRNWLTTKNAVEEYIRNMQ